MFARREFGAAIGMGNRAGCGANREESGCPNNSANGAEHSTACDQSREAAKAGTHQHPAGRFNCLRVGRLSHILLERLIELVGVRAEEHHQKAQAADAENNEDTLCVREADNLRLHRVRLVARQAGRLNVDNPKDGAAAERDQEDGLAEECEGGILWVLEGFEHCGGHENWQRDGDSQDDSCEDIIVRDENHKSRARQPTEEFNCLPIEVFAFVTACQKFQRPGVGGALTSAQRLSICP
mmetsp:Transcript_17338/g.46950  ORF Transcript_17338/g.46950 Transcript_17338/m.46950 type:complete len:239 (+) Transcript_17338:450-1166(+)